jgi:hypothetical protein
MDYSVFYRNYPKKEDYLKKNDSKKKSVTKPKDGKKCFYELFI